VTPAGGDDSAANSGSGDTQASNAHVWLMLPRRPTSLSTAAIPSLAQACKCSHAIDPVHKLTLKLLLALLPAGCAPARQYNRRGAVRW
jgi:hypothetical protein